MIVDHVVGVRFPVGALVHRSSVFVSGFATLENTSQAKVYKSGHVRCARKQHLQWAMV
jgi:hypothetical protein